VSGSSLRTGVARVVVAAADTHVQAVSSPLANVGVMRSAARGVELTRLTCFATLERREGLSAQQMVSGAQKQGECSCSGLCSHHAQRPRRRAQAAGSGNFMRRIYAIGPPPH